VARRILFAALAALAGSTAGFVLHQLRERSAEIDSGDVDLYVAAPVSAAGLATIVGVVGGRRGPVFAFIAGAAISFFFGSDLDDRILGVLTGGHDDSANSTSSSASSA